MFTGLVELTGRVAAVRPRGGVTRLVVEAGFDGEPVGHGDSVAIDGVCLTAVGFGPGTLEFDAIPETLARTTLGGLRPGASVNLERALRVGDRLGGHLVQGHVDAVAPVRNVIRRGDDWRVRVALVPEIDRYVAQKGSVALSGVSLTVSALVGGCFEVALIPETLEATTLGALRAGDRVNVEVDLVARYLERLIGRSG